MIKYDDGKLCVPKKKKKKHIHETKKHSRYSPYYRVLTSHNYLEESIDLFHCNIFFLCMKDYFLNSNLSFICVK